MNRTEINRLLTSIKTWVNPISEQNCHFKKAKMNRNSKEKKTIKRGVSLSSIFYIVTLKTNKSKRIHSPKYSKRFSFQPQLQLFIHQPFFFFFNRQFEPLCPEAPDMLQFKSIEEWLASLKLSRYVDNFQQAGVTTLDAVTRLSHADLSGLGIILLGHQRKIMNSIQAMRAQLSISMSEGFLV